MSNTLALAAVTSTLRFVIEKAVLQDPTLAGTTITTKPPGTARGTNRGKQLNLFLYEVRPNAGFSNGDPRGPAKSGELGFPPLALNLYYLVTAYGDERDDEDTISQQILGRAMAALHDHPLLGAAEIHNALPASDLDQQIERVRISFEALSNEDIWKLWSAFQTPFRLSAAYQASVVLIDSTRAVRAALPVLRRGNDDRGVQTVPSPSPTLESVVPAAAPSRPGVSLGDDLIARGQNLSGEGIGVRLIGPAGLAARSLVPGPGSTANELRVHLPAPAEDPDLSKFAPGIYRMALVIDRPDLPAWTTNEIPFGLAPQISRSPATAPAGDLELSVTCRPRLRDGQRILLLFGDRQAAVDTLTTPADPAQPSTVTFRLTAVPMGSYLVRLRVDGVDSLPVVLSGDPPRFDFDPALRVTVT